MFRPLGNTVVVETDVEELRQLAKEEARKQTAAERSAILEQFRDTGRQTQLTHIFRTPVIRNGKKVVLSDNAANVAVLESLANPGEEVNFDWFNAHYSEPSFDRLVWEPWLDQKERAKRDREQAQANRQRALSLTRQYGLSECESNLSLLANSTGTVVWANNTPYLFADDQEAELVPASSLELQKYAQEKQDQHQAYLQELSEKGDIAGLRRAAAQERTARNSEPTWKEKFHNELIAQFAKDTQVGFRTPLPGHVTPEYIRKLDANQLRQLMKRYGASRISAKLYSISELPDGRGGIIRFE